MFYEPDNRNHGLKYSPLKALVVPRPIAWISTLDGDGRPNLAPHSQFNLVASEPACVMFASSLRDDGSAKDSRYWAERTGDFFVNLATYEFRDEINRTSAMFPRGESESLAVGLELMPSRLIKSPSVICSPVHLECIFLQSIELPSDRPRTGNFVTFGRVIGVYIEDGLIVDGRVDICRARPIARLGYMDYAVIDEVFEMIAPSRAGMAFASEQSGSLHNTGTSLACGTDSSLRP
jgi:flavin reductase (DIM6/NTAB) family NADH-FMN oxidoreductase RutF